MWHIQTTADDQAQGDLREMYDQDMKNDGYVWNTSRIWSQRPETGAQWKQLQKTIRSHLRLRPYELVTLAAARAMDCEYCLLAHGNTLHKNGFTVEQVIELIKDYHNAGLSPAEVHMMDYADKISRDSAMVGPADIEPLRADGLSDQQITDIALAAVMRNFLSRFFHALGADADPELIAKEPELWAYIQERQRAAARTPSTGD
jgi:uncharacterized peroxidase-related enzyme